MRSKHRADSKMTSPLLSSRKDRLGTILLFLGVISYLMLSQPTLTTTTRWNFTEVPLKEKRPAPRSPGTHNYPKKNKKVSQGYTGHPAVKEYALHRYSQRDSYFSKGAYLTRFTGSPTTKSSKAVLLNSADSSDWEQLPGIGPVLAARILKYREKLGGFHSTAQLKEVYGVSDSVYEKISSRIQVGQAELRKLDINSSSLEELKVHPYVRWETARSIVRYREANGPFSSLNDLKNIWSISEETFKRIEPYLCLGKDTLTRK